MKPNPPAPTNCDAYEAVVQRVLDREIGPEALADSHAAACPGCRRLAAAAAVFATGLDRIRTRGPVEVARTDRIAAAAVNDFRYRRRVAWASRATGVALAASVFIAVAAYLPRLGDGPPVQRTVSGVPQISPDPSPTPTPDRVGDRVVDATAALASITKKATERTLMPRMLIPTPERVALPDAELTSTVEPATESLATVSQSAKSGIEPMTTGAKRAMNLFLRDTGIAPKPKS